MSSIHSILISIIIGTISSMTKHGSKKRHMTKCRSKERHVTKCTAQKRDMCLALDLVVEPEQIKSLHIIWDLFLSRRRDCISISRYIMQVIYLLLLWLYCITKSLPKRWAINLFSSIWHSEGCELRLYIIDMIWPPHTRNWKRQPSIIHPTLPFQIIK